MLLAALVVAGSPLSLLADDAGSAPDFHEVYDLIKQHATGAGLNDSDLNRAAVEGLVSKLSPKVMLVSDHAKTNTANGAPPVTQTTIFEGDIAYLRVTHVEDGLAKAIGGALDELKSTNKVNGVVLDLRYADGVDYEAAAATADLFVNKSQPLLNWGNGVVSSHEKTNAVTVPVVVLVNHQTAGAAEALAAMVREVSVGLILGSPSAGQAMMMQDYPLKNGDHLRIASSPITLGSGTTLAKGVKPDIDVTVSEDAEKAFYADAFFVAPNTNRAAGATNDVNGTNQPAPRVRFNEAELVREHKAGENSPDEETAKRLPEPKIPVVSDPALARALDLLKGLAVVRQANS